jgi:6-pyruvoyltetrahydropterin/6-carboxytetrahydropterin synthase
MYTITKRFTFAAAHMLHGLPPGHQCSRLHGHNYAVIVELQAQDLNEVGFVVDYGDLKPLKEYIDSNLDHRYLNDVLPFQTSAENIAKHLFDLARRYWPQTVSVTVCETENTTAKYSA